MKIVISAVLILVLVPLAGAQSEVLTNARVIEMSRSGLGSQVILSKIKMADCDFDVSTGELIKLKKAGVDDEVIAFMLEKSSSCRAKVSTEMNSPAPLIPPTSSSPVGYSESPPADESKLFNRTAPTAKEALLNARTVAFVKSSLHPSRQALEKALFKRSEWKKYNLTIIRYKEEADLYVEIGRIPLTWLSHRYVFRIYDRRSGAVLTAGETTSWGSLAENLAREITQKLDAVTKN